VLAGTSTISLSGSNASLQVCGRNLSGTSTKVAIYGPTASAATTLADTLVPGSNPTGSSWGSAANAKLVDGTVATYNNLNKGSTTSILTLPSLTGARALPTTIISPITAEVTGLATMDAKFIVQVRSNTTTVCTSTAAPLPLTTSATVSVNFNCTGVLSTPLSIRLTATAGTNVGARSIQIDGVILKYSVAGTPIAAQSGSDAVSMNNAGGQLWLGGRVYLPRAKMSIRLKDGSTVLSTQPMVVRSLDVTTSGSTSTGTVAADTVVQMQLRPGDVTIAASVGDRMSMTCRVSYAVAGAVVTGYTVKGCTIPR
jgi:hypothetical protein